MIVLQKSCRSHQRRAISAANAPQEFAGRFVYVSPSKARFCKGLHMRNAEWERSDHVRLLRSILCRDDAQKKPAHSRGFASPPTPANPAFF